MTTVSVRRLLLAAVALVAASLPAIVANPFLMHTATMVLINATLAVGLFLVSRVGQLSLCHAAFAGIGAYVSANLVMKGDASFLAGLALSGMTTGLIAAGLGWVILRIRGVYFVLVTFAFGQIAGLIFLDFEPMTGGAVGLPGIPAPVILGLKLDSSHKFYYLALLVAVLAFLFVQRLLDGPSGAAFSAIRSKIRLAEANGIAVLHHQVAAFAVGSGLGGVAGSLMGHYVGFVAPGSFDLWLSVSLIIMLVIGGRDSLLGVFLGSLLLTPLPELLRGSHELQSIIYGLVVIVALRFMPKGVADLVYRVPGMRPLKTAEARL